MDTFLAGASCGVAAITVGWLIVGHVREYRRRGRQNTEDYHKIVRLEKDVEWFKAARESDLQQRTRERASTKAKPATGIK